MSNPKFNDIVHVSYKLGFEGAWAGFNKTCTITNDNDYIKKGTKITYKALLNLAERLATMQTRVVKTHDGIHEQLVGSQDLGWLLTYKFIQNSIEFELKGGSANLTQKTLYDSFAKEFILKPLVVQ